MSDTDLGAEFDEAEQLGLQAMSAELACIYGFVAHSVTEVFMAWHEHRAMFGRGALRINLMNDVAPFFFYRLERLNWSDLLLRLCRLTDAAGSRGQRNATLRSLPDLIAQEPLRRDLAALVDTAVVDTEFARTWRNKEIAHSDFDTVRGASALPEATEVEVNRALKSVSAVVSAVQSHYMSSATDFGLMQVRRGANDLMTHLARTVEQEPEANGA